MKFSSPVFVCVPQNFEYLVHVITQRCVYLLFRSVFPLSWFSAHSRSRGIPAFCCLQRFFQPNNLMRCCQESLLQLQSSHQPWPSFSPICFPLPSSLLPAAAANILGYISNLNRSPSPLRKNVRISTGSRLYIFLDYSSWTSFILISFSFSPSWWICGCFSSFFFLFCTSGRVFQQTALPRVAEAALWLAAGEVYAPISSCTSTVALRKHLSWACSCSGTAWTSCCVTTLIARAHGEYSTDHNYRGGREKKWPQRKRQMGDTSESTLLRREVQKKNHFVYTKSVFLFSFFPVVSTLAPPPSSQTILIGLVKFQLP